MCRRRGGIHASQWVHGCNSTNRGSDGSDNRGQNGRGRLASRVSGGSSGNRGRGKGLIGQRVYRKSKTTGGKATS